MRKRSLRRSLAFLAAAASCAGLIWQPPLRVQAATDVTLEEYERLPENLIIDSDVTLMVIGDGEVGLYPAG